MDRERIGWRLKASTCSEGRVEVLALPQIISCHAYCVILKAESEMSGLWIGAPAGAATFRGWIHGSVNQRQPCLQEEDSNGLHEKSSLALEATSAWQRINYIIWKCKPCCLDLLQKEMAGYLGSLLHKRSRADSYFLNSLQQLKTSCGKQVWFEWEIPTQKTAGLRLANELTLLCFNCGDA